MWLPLSSCMAFLCQGMTAVRSHSEAILYNWFVCYLQGKACSRFAHCCSEQLLLSSESEILQ